MVTFVNLEKKTEKHIEVIPTTYGIETDYLCNKAKDNTRRTIISNMLRDLAVIIKKIVKFTGIFVDFVQEIEHGAKQR